MLTDTRIRQAKPKAKAFKLIDSHGLYVHVSPAGGKVFRYAYSIGGKAGCYTIGPYPTITLEAARSERARCRVLVKDGTHPKQHRDQQQAVKRVEQGNTFEIIAREYIERGRKGLASKHPWTARYAEKVEQEMSDYVFPAVGSLPIRSVGASHIRHILDAVVSLGYPTVAINIRQQCSNTFALACITDRADTDPTYALRGYVVRPNVKHKQPLTKDGIKEMSAKIETTGFPQTKIALKLLMRLFVRPIELRRAHWSEVDLDNALWTIPAEHMKKREKHLVPLSKQVLELLHELRGMTGTRKHLFPNHRRPETFMAEGSLNQALRRVGYQPGQFSAHGFRATASTELHEMNYDPKIIEFQLSHAERDDTAASYNSAQYLSVRRDMMETWSTLVDQWSRDGSSKVVPIGKAA